MKAIAVVPDDRADLRSGEVDPGPIYLRAPAQWVPALALHSGVVRRYGALGQDDSEFRQ
jgi:hypothetical protein